MTAPEENGQPPEIQTTSLQDFLQRLDARAELIVGREIADEIASRAHDAIAARLAERKERGSFKPGSSIAEQRAIAANRLPGIII